jgi:hypothetical protein
MIARAGPDPLQIGAAACWSLWPLARRSHLRGDQGPPGLRDHAALVPELGPPRRAVPAWTFQRREPDLRRTGPSGKGEGSHHAMLSQDRSDLRRRPGLGAAAAVAGGHSATCPRQPACRKSPNPHSRNAPGARDRRGVSGQTAEVEGTLWGIRKRTGRRGAGWRVRRGVWRGQGRSPRCRGSCRF